MTLTKENLLDIGSDTRANSIASAPAISDTNETAKPLELQRMGLACLIAFSLVWLIELFWVQGTTLVTSHSGGPQFNYWAPKIRLLLDAFFIGSLCTLFRVRLLAIVAVLGFVLNLALVSYTNYFHRPLTMYTVFSAYREGAQMSRFIWEWLPKWPAAILLAICLIKFGLLWKARKVILPLKIRGVFFAGFATAFASVFCATLWLDPLSMILKTRGVARLGIIRGYTGPWMAELYYLRDPRLLKNAIDRVRIQSDILTPREVIAPIHNRLVIIQVESLDYNVLGYKVNGKEVTPFLNQLREQSLFYRARAYHTIGSADADFTMLAGGPPAMNVLNYSLPDFPYDGSLPRFLGDFGFSTSSFHGNSGSFYNRRDAFKKMGFSEIFFREDLEPLGAFATDSIGLRDKDVLAYSSLRLRRSTTPTCHFIITLTSHSPYVFVEPSNLSLIPKPTDSAERYFNHINYVDSCLRDYVTSLGRNVTVVIYADHPTESGRGDFTPARTETAKYVPVFIFDTGRNLAELQRTRTTVATSGELKMIDISAYLRNCVAASFPTQSRETRSETRRSRQDARSP